MKATLKPLLVTIILLTIVFLIKSPLKVWLNPPFIIPNQYYVHTKSIEFTEYGLVTSVADGDTITVDADQTVRLLGIDTPELSHPQQYIKEECYGRSAKARIQQLVLYKNVYLLKDKENVDKYGRKLRYVFVADEKNPDRLLFVNAYMIGEGFARAYIFSPDELFKKEIISLQKEAKTFRSGLWGECDRESFRW